MAHLFVLKPTKQKEFNEWCNFVVGAQYSSFFSERNRVINA